MEEENLLEYRPLLEREERLATNWRLPQEETPTTPTANRPATGKPGSGIVTETIKEFETIKTTIQDKLTTLEKENFKIRFPIPPAQAADVTRAKIELGLTGDELTITDYRKALEEKDTPAGDFLLEVIEDWIEGLEGNIQLESYAQYFQLQEETSLLDSYLSKILYPAMGLKQVDTQDPNWEKILEVNEKAWHKEQQLKLAAYEQSERAHLQSYLKYPERMEQTFGKLYEEKKTKRDAENRIAQANEALVLLRAKTQDIQNLFIETEEAETRNPYPEKTSVLSGLAEMTRNDADWQANLTNFGLMLTLSVDTKNKDKHHVKNTLRHTYSPGNREKLLGELSVYDEIYQTTALQALHLGEAYDETIAPELETLLNQVADGLLETSKQKKAKTKELYSLTRATTRLQQKTIQQMAEKDDARQGYHLIQEIKEKTKDTGMPDSQSLSQLLES